MGFMEIQTPDGEHIVVQNTCDSLPRAGEYFYAYDGVRATIVDRVEWKAHRATESGIDLFTPTVVLRYAAQHVHDLS